MEELTNTTILPKTKSLFSIHHLKKYFLVLLSMLGIIGIYYLFFGSRTMGVPSGAAPPQGTAPPQTNPPGTAPNPPNDIPPTDGIPGMMPTQGMGANNLWPLWGTLTPITAVGFIIFLLTLFIGSVLIWKLIQNTSIKNKLGLMVLLGVGIMVTTNLIHGWQIGIYSAIGSPSEIYSDVWKVNSIFSFISSYEALQPNLSIHAQTQPPGAILWIYILSLISNDPAHIALMLAIGASSLSSLFLYGFMKRMFDKRYAEYVVMLYLLLPAIQVYYLANIYAIVSTLILGVLYFYFHSQTKTRVIGTSIFMFLAIFTSFLSIFIPLCLGLYELLVLFKNGYLKKAKFQTLGGSGWIREVWQQVQIYIFACIAVIAILGLIWMGLGFNYLNAFLYASELENPGGFMLLTNPTNYFVTRLQNVLDIAIFYGPILGYLSYRGYKILKSENDLFVPTTQIGQESKQEQKPMDKSIYYLPLAALLALGLMFLVGAPKKGETARICMFILPFLLVYLMAYLKSKDFEQKQLIWLLIVVLLQTLILQSMATYIW